MTERSLCKGCSESVVVKEEAIEKLVKEADNDKPQVVSDEIYEQRLRICHSCPSLQYGTTCAYCGCLVRHRAKFKNKGCPFVGKPKWKKLVK